MKVLMLNGSPRKDGNTAASLKEMEAIFVKEGIEVETVHVGALEIRGCLNCGACSKLGKCVIDDIVNEIAEKLKEADGMVVGTPVYYGSVNGTLMSILSRLFFSSAFDKTMKVGAGVVIARRGGCSTTFDQLNKYFTISGMPVVSSQYWNSVHGLVPGETAEDPEGLQTMRVLARNMVFLMKSIALGKEQFGLPEKEKRYFTNFVR